MPQPTAPIPRYLLTRFFCSAVAFGLCILGPPAVVAQNETAESAALREELKKIRKPLLEDMAAAKESVKKSTFDTIVYRGATNAAADKKLSDGLRISLFLMTDPELKPSELPEMRQKFMRVIDGAGRLIGNPGQVRKHREKILTQVTDLCAQMLDGNYYVRIQAIKILGSLNLEPGRPGKPPLVYTGSRSVLLRVATDKGQPHELRALAFTGLVRLIRYAKLSKPEEMEIGVALAEELMRKDIPSGYQALLASMISELHYTFEVRGNQRPIALMAAAMSMTDPSRSWEARAQAARAIGRTGDGPASIKWEPLAYKVAEFAHEAALKYNTEPMEDVDDYTFWYIFTSYHHLTADEVALRKGLLNRSSSPYVRDAYTKVLPLVKHVIGKPGEKIPAESVAELQKWLAQNVPQNMQYHPSAPPLPNQQQVAAGGSAAP